MSLLAFVVMAFMLSMYVILDGYDLGVAVIAPIVARTEQQRRAMMESIGPFWNGNEVWLIAAGGTLFALFPLAYAASFSAFYLPFMLVLWLLMFRGIAIELRNQFSSELWKSFWDTAFNLSSVLLVFLYGITLGNLIRGLPLDRHAYFVGTFAFLLNPYALGVGVLAVITLALHGAAFLLMRVDGAPAERSRTFIKVVWWLVLALYLGLTSATLAQRWQLAGHGISLWLAIGPFMSLGSLIALRVLVARGATWGVFAASTAFIVTLQILAGGTMYPYILPSYPFGSGGLRVIDAVPGAGALALMLTIAILGLASVCVYSYFITRRLSGKIHVD